MKTKICTECKTEYPATDEFFYRDSHTKNFIAACKPCRIERQLKLYYADRENRCEYQGRYYEANKARIKEIHREYIVNRLRTNSNVRMYNRALSALRNYFHLYSQPSDFLLEMTGASLIELKQWKDFYLHKRKENNGYIEIHHFIPITCFPDLTDPAQLRAAFSLKNTMFLTRAEHHKIEDKVRPLKPQIKDEIIRRFPH